MMVTIPCGVKNMSQESTCITRTRKSSLAAARMARESAGKSGVCDAGISTAWWLTGTVAVVAGSTATRAAMSGAVGGALSAESIMVPSNAHPSAVPTPPRDVREEASRAISTDALRL